MKKQYYLKLFVCLLVGGLLFLGLTGPSASAKNDNNDVKLRVFVHYPKPGLDKGKPQGPVCQITANEQVANYGLTGWKLPDSAVVYKINYNTNSFGISNDSLKLAVDNAFQAWATSGLSFQDGGATGAVRAQNDGINLVAWGSVPNNAIAVTYTWYYQNTGQWVESDTILNKKLKWAVTPYTTDCAGTAGAYDVQNIMTHENGHWVGLDDLYDLASRDLTMYGYGFTGELKKDTLGWGDSLGVKSIYR
ncbi:MAG: hypothetical protein PHY72_03525 [Candidatus Pacebacteria bacterium]|nr:hypothetical protein [Candidatus Paceibacterota bacterium]